MSTPCQPFAAMTRRTPFLFHSGCTAPFTPLAGYTYQFLTLEQVMKLQWMLKSAVAQTGTVDFEKEPHERVCWQYPSQSRKYSIALNSNGQIPLYTPYSWLEMRVAQYHSEDAELDLNLRRWILRDPFFGAYDFTSNDGSGLHRSVTLSCWNYYSVGTIQSKWTFGGTWNWYYPYKIKVSVQEVDGIPLVVLQEIAGNPMEEVFSSEFLAPPTLNFYECTT